LLRELAIVKLGTSKLEEVIETTRAMFDCLSDDFNTVSVHIPSDINSEQAEKILECCLAGSDKKAKLCVRAKLEDKISAEDQEHSTPCVARVNT